jgi:hypothetical protein
MCCGVVWLWNICGDCVQIKVNLWNLKMYTATVFKKEQQPMLEKYFKEK